MKNFFQLFLFWGAVFLFLLLFTETSSAQMASYSYDNPLGTTNSFSDWFGNLLVSIQGVVGWLAVIMIVIGGLIYITSGGSVRQTTLGKTIVVYAMAGFAIAVAAPSLLREIRDIASAGLGGGPSIISTAKPIQEIIADVMDFLLTAIGMLAIVGFIIGGILYISAGGDMQKADKAKKAVFYSTIAIVVSGAALIILRQVIQILEA